MSWVVRYHVSKSFARVTDTLDTWPRYWDEGPFKRKITAIRKRRKANKERALFWVKDSDPFDLPAVDYGPSYCKVEILEVTP